MFDQDHNREGLQEGLVWNLEVPESMGQNCEWTYKWLGMRTCTPSCLVSTEDHGKRGKATGISYQSDHSDS